MINEKIITGVLLGLTCTYALGNQEKYVKYRLVANNGFVIALIALEYKNISEKERKK
jgi:arginine exporter protein ArgO